MTDTPIHCVLCGGLLYVEHPIHPDRHAACIAADSRKQREAARAAVESAEVTRLRALNARLEGEATDLCRALESTDQSWRATRLRAALATAREEVQG